MHNSKCNENNELLENRKEIMMEVINFRRLLNVSDDNNTLTDTDGGDDKTKIEPLSTLVIVLWVILLLIVITLILTGFYFYYYYNRRSGEYAFIGGQSSLVYNWSILEYEYDAKISTETKTATNESNNQTKNIGIITKSMIFLCCYK